MQLPSIPDPRQVFSSGNAVFQGGLGLMAIGAAATWAKGAPKALWRYATKGFWITVQADDNDESWHWLVRWLSYNLDEKTSTAYRVASHWGDDDEGGGHKRMTLLVPGPSQRVLKYRGAKMFVNFGEITEGTKRTDTVTIVCRKKHRKLLTQLLQEVTDLEKRPDPTVTKIYRPGNRGEKWKRHATRPKRVAESIILDGETFTTLLNQLKEFEGKYDWYLELGIPYRIGVMLYGLPGNGKSSLAFALAGALNRDLYVLPLGDTLMDDATLVDLMGHLPSKSLVVMEDFDTVFHGRKREADNKLTLSGLLNVMDGPLATEGRILIITTNKPEVLDPALVRSGRIDIRCELKNATPNQARRLFARFFTDATVEQQEQFAAWAGDGRYCMSSLQAHLVKNMRSLQAALEYQPPEALVVVQEALVPTIGADDDEDA